ncbi:MAG TPA: Rrf2 family transcriptional regulator [Candidatus Limnocylindrales bacterium]|nr:Rrf2 family transcriptional regulator [Candidatus Limnocylindrales bacterium]
MRLDLTRRADYAVRAVLALAAAGRRLPSAELARRMEIPPAFLPQILPALVRDSILARTLGRRGGYHLARSADKISLLAVIEAADGPRERGPASCAAAPAGANGRVPCIPRWPRRRRPCAPRCRVPTSRRWCARHETEVADVLTV